LVEERLGKLITDEATVIETSLAQYGDLDLVEERLGKLITDEATVIETSLAQYGDLVYPDKTSILYK
jgi:3-hydroxyisobutyryl-CoA hydrolase